MFRKTITGSLMAVSLTAGALMTMSTASAAPAWVEGTSISHSGLLPEDAAFAMSENGTAIASWIREVGGVDRVQASFFTGGSAGDWTFPDTLTDASDVVATPDVAINNKGAAVVTWLEEDNSGDMRVASSRYLGQGTFDGRDLISTDNQLDATGPISTALDGKGTIWVAHRDTDNNTKNRIRVSTKSTASDPVSLTLTDDTSFTPSLAVNEAGQAILAWYDAGDGESEIKVRRYRPEVFAWTQPEATSVATQYSASDVRTAINDGGDGVIAYVQKDSGDDMRAAVAKSRPDGFLSSTVYASATDVPAGGVDVALNDAGQTLVSWDETDNGHRVRYVSRDYNGQFGSINTVAGVLAGPTTTAAAISDTGMRIVGFADNGQQRAAYKVSPISPTQTFNSGPLGFQAGETGVGVDNQGNALLGGVMKFNATDGSVYGAFLDTAGPTTSLTAPAPNTLGTAFGVTWTATDRFSAIQDGRVRVRAAAWNGSFGAHTFLGDYSADQSLAFAGVPGRTYCFSGQARDENVNVGGFGAEKCTTTPVDDRTLKMAKGFKRANGGAHYRGTYSVATTKGATLTLKNVHASRIAILVTKAAKGGKIQVLFGKKVIGTYSLKGSGVKKLVAQKSLGGSKVGTLTIKVVSASGKVVKIDGVVAAK